MKSRLQTDLAAHRRTLAWLEQLSEAEHIALLQRAGILDEDGQLAERYREGLLDEDDRSPRPAG